MITSPIWACLCLIILRVGAKPSFEGPVEISELFGSPEDRVEEVYDDEPEEPDRTVVRVDENFQNCSDFAVDGYRCVSYEQCVDGEILTSGAGLIDVRNGFLEPEVSHCPSYLEVCCRLATHFGQPISPRPKPPTRAQFVSSCGKRNQDGVQVRIQSDSLSGATQFGEWPHMCVVLRKVLVVGEEISTYLCGGSLIHQNVILTAAHCVQKYDPSEIRVRCGEWDTQQTIEPLPHADRDVRYSSIHPGFNNASLHNDFALLHLEEPFELAPHIDVMCLPTEERLGYIKADCIATGWGKDQFGVRGKYQVIPKQISLDLVSNADCEQTLRNTRLGEFFILDKSFMCAGGQEGEDTCKGDGGGPLICPMDDGSYVQTGIVAWGIDCGKNGIPGVYADVQDGLCFIDYALRCQEGKDVAEQIGIKGCKGWMRDQVKLLREQKFKYQNLVAVTEGRSKASHNRKLQDTNQLIRKFARFKRECKLNRQEEIETDVEEEIDPVDVSGFVRIGGGGLEPEPKIEVKSENAQVAEPESETETSTETTTLSPFAEIVEEIDQ